ncbi:hypothetical protein HZU77_001035 [Neisseriaceae bacterium TC5R-5]|nr:hypothetical protein [Neisseriaceae bacterium TC5R-5]
MAVKFSRFACLLLVLPLLALAAKDDVKAIHAIAQAGLQQAISLSEKNYQECDDRQIVLPKNLFDGIDLSDDDKRTVLSYFSIKAQSACNSPAMMTLLRATLFAREVKLPDYSAADDPEALRVLFALHPLPLELRYEARYLQLPESERKALEKLVPLQQGFKLRESAKNLGLYE